MAATLTSMGHHVLQLQEDAPESWKFLRESVESYEADVVLWTRTWVLDHQEQRDALLRVERPIVGFHLDRWWGLNREHQIKVEPFFTHSDLMITADGGHDQQWADAGVKHFWMPPAVYRAEALQSETASTDERFRTQIGFVGSWAGYHAEWSWRKRLVDWLYATYPGRFKVWPHGSQPAVRGDALARLYHSIDVIVGDSCLAGNISNYWSDRIPETLGRGGFLLHPKVDGLDAHFEYDKHLGVFEPCDFASLRERIDFWLDNPHERADVASAGREHVLAHHTYDNRMSQLIELLIELDMIDD